MAFMTLLAIDEWVTEKGGGETGEAALRTSLARGDFNDNRTIGLVKEWLRCEEEKRLDEYSRSAVGAAVRSAVASERSAKYTLWAAVAALVAAAVAIVPVVSGWFRTCG
ncbi:hypothetical protein FB547_10918 [Variovorax beijingensis]|uniref:Uncharacterized protein n=1 Tax=Variovorax beijingensis TaxID=2496117 RepID=A0A561BF20_9BURK|nr:hypothetical protein [Variovorax beijingensis]TWD77484.1 hypothetical protein FB547_10918 [Variovorax beijingensis]